MNDEHWGEQHDGYGKHAIRTHNDGWSTHREVTYPGLVRVHRAYDGMTVSRVGDNSFGWSETIAEVEYTPRHGK